MLRSTETIVSLMIFVPTCSALCLHLFHQPGPLDNFCKARVVLDVRRDGQLSSRLNALDNDGFKALHVLHRPLPYTRRDQTQ